MSGQGGFPIERLAAQITHIGLFWAVTAHVQTEVIASRELPAAHLARNQRGAVMVPHMVVPAHLTLKQFAADVARVEFFTAMAGRHVLL